MGAKHNWGRKHILLLFANIVCLFLGAFGCSHFPKSIIAQNIIKEAMDDMIAGQHESAMEKNLKVINNYPYNLADEAVYQMGLLYALPGHPEHNYEKSHTLISSIKVNSKKELLKNNASLWILFIREAINKEERIAAISNKNQSLESTVKHQKTEITAMQNTIEKQKAKIDQLTDQIEQLKNIDFGIEERKQGIFKYYEKP